MLTKKTFTLALANTSHRISGYCFVIFNSFLDFKIYFAWWEDLKCTYYTTKSPFNNYVIEKILFLTPPSPLVVVSYFSCYPSSLVNISLSKYKLSFVLFNFQRGKRACNIVFLAKFFSCLRRCTKCVKISWKYHQQNIRNLHRTPVTFFRCLRRVFNKVILAIFFRACGAAQKCKTKVKIPWTKYYVIFAEPPWLYFGVCDVPLIR